MAAGSVCPLEHGPIYRRCVALASWYAEKKAASFPPRLHTYCVKRLLPHGSLKSRTADTTFYSRRPKLF